MVKDRKVLGLLFSYSNNWIGGTYYFLNMVQSFHQLSEEKKPHIIVLSDDIASFNKIRETGYPYLSYLNASFNYSFFERALNLLSRKLFKKNLIHKGYSNEQLPVLFGYYEQLPLYKCSRKIYWIPDLQDKYYPEYLGNEVAEIRKTQHEKIAYSKNEVVFSSQDSENSFEKFYPGSVCKKYVVPFAVSLPVLDFNLIESVLAKYQIKDSFYISPNQFWKHKNHFIIIKAIESLKKSGIEVMVVFTGNEDTGGGIYASELKEYVKTHNLQDNCIFLGFIDRKEQLILMQAAKAVIQPSLFEGWSTVVEDAKSLGKWLILSDLPVHREQTNKNVNFFNPLDIESLKDQLILAENTNLVPEKINYKSRILEFAESLIKLL